MGLYNNPENVDGPYKNAGGCGGDGGAPQEWFQRVSDQLNRFARKGRS